VEAVERLERRLPHVAPKGGGGARIIVLDDDEAVLKVIARVLRKAGYVVDAFTDAEAAIGALGQEHASYSVMITDRTMPRLSGLEVARRASAIDPGMAIILLSGATHGGDAESPGISALVAKPADAATLLRAVARECANRISEAELKTVA
jgi:CheY-like chemotaxis protein